MPQQLISYLLLAFFICGAWFLDGCGSVGPPISPEDIGIDVKVRSQKKSVEESVESHERDIVPLDQQTVPLPPLQPLGL